MSTEPAEDEAEEEWGWSLLTLNCGVDGEEASGEFTGTCVDDEIDVKDLMRREWEGLRLSLVVTWVSSAMREGGASGLDLTLSDFSRLNVRALTKRRMLILMTIQKRRNMGYKGRRSEVDDRIEAKVEE